MKGLEAWLVFIFALLLAVFLGIKVWKLDHYPFGLASMFFGFYLFGASRKNVQ